MSSIDRQYPAGTIDIVPVMITLEDGSIPASGNVQVAIGSPSAPSSGLSWVASTVAAPLYGFLLSGNETVGSHRLWAKVSGNPETKIFDAGIFYVTTPAPEANRGAVPADPTTPVGLVRLLDGDSDPTNVSGSVGSYAWYSDAEITGLLSILGTPAHVAIHILRIVSLSPAMILKKWVSADLSVDGARITEVLAAAIDKLEKSIAAGVATGAADGFAIVGGGAVHGGPGLYGLSTPFDRELTEDPLNLGSFVYGV